MAFNFDSIGKTTAPQFFEYTWKDTVLYALGIGATGDELDYLYEGRGPKVYPSFAVLASYPPLAAALSASEGDWMKVVHGSQKVVMHADIPPQGKLRTTAHIEGIYDLKKMAQVIVHTKTVDDATGVHLFDTEWGIIYLGEGGFGGASRPDEERPSTPQRPCDFRVEETTSSTQALLYRLSGDLNPLHADPEFPLVARFNGKPILHGLATYGFMTRAVTRAALGGDSRRIKSISARFARPVWPGETLVTEGWIEGNHVIAKTSVKERNHEGVLTQVWLEIANA